MADARVPLHPAPRPGGSPQCPSLRLVGQRRCARRPGLGLPACPRFLPRPAAAGGGRRRRVRQLPCRTGRSLHQGAVRLHDHRLGAGRSQRPARSLRRRQCRGLRGDGPAAGPRHGHAGLARARHLGADTGGPGGQPDDVGPAARAPNRGLRRWLARRPQGQRCGGRPGRRLGRARRPLGVPRDGAT